MKKIEDALTRMDQIVEESAKPNKPESGIFRFYTDRLPEGFGMEFWPENLRTIPAWRCWTCFLRSDL
jgi:hypothetical protein